MIVACPSCNTRYRHRVDPVSAPTRARCSRCDERFPIVGRRPYVMLPLRRGPGGILDAGMLTVAEAALPAAAAPGAMRSSAGRDGLMAFLLGSVGALAGYYGALWQSADMPAWTTAGAGVGMVLGWAWFRWRAPRH